MLATARLAAVIASGALALILTAASGSAQKALPPLPTPDAPPPVPAILQNYKAVTADRLTKPEDGDWLQYRRTYDGWGYSPLSQINAGNAAKLKPIRNLVTGVTAGHPHPQMAN